MHTVRSALELLTAAYAGWAGSLPPATVDEATTEEDAGLSPESVAIALPIFGLDAAKLQCVDAALPPFASDDEAALAALQAAGLR